MLPLPKNDPHDRVISAASIIGQLTNGKVESIEVAGTQVPQITGDLWTAKQRTASSLHEISYRACFKPQLPRFFIERLTVQGGTVYDPFSGRGTTPLEAALMGREIISNDANPLSTILGRPRVMPPDLESISDRLDRIDLEEGSDSDIDLSMFYHRKTEREIVSLRTYLEERRVDSTEDPVDSWIRMVATNRLTGHSPGFFSVYTLPPNQAASPSSQSRINALKGQVPPYRDVKALILRKSRRLLKDVDPETRANMTRIGRRGMFLEDDAASTEAIGPSTVDLTVTSPPFLNIVQYRQDNWLRSWFNSLDADDVAKRLKIVNSVKTWTSYMERVFRELERITRPGGFLAFEVGEVRKGTVRLEETVAPLGARTGWSLIAILLNVQRFTKTSNIWGVDNNKKGTNTNRIALFRKTPDRAS